MRWRTTTERALSLSIRTGCWVARREKRRWAAAAWAAGWAASGRKEKEGMGQREREGSLEGVRVLFSKKKFLLLI
jgi:hypothetical protein